MMIDIKQIQAIFLFEFKMGCKAAETTLNINNTFDPESAKEHTLQWWFKKFCKEYEIFDDEEHSGWTSEVDNEQLRAIIEADPLIATKKLPKNSTLTIYADHKSKKNRHFEVLCSLILHNKNEPFLDRIVTCAEKQIL
ncbi:hypothetical protein FD755_025084 [Muntiacus reevesi]|uniref:Mos1 transposase HTH domain-containing protein n=1 Tax=Muntiacus reevesi TaxID=9886 RepID=A0A5N3UQH7_MUNRE|nr:hypothetical protein FD755_025084 [Muntiacus reevesi]